VAEAGRLLREGGLVAFPTETVYGLGASVYDEAAVRRIFEVRCSCVSVSLCVCWGMGMVGGLLGLLGCVCVCGWIDRSTR
jgi:hypothetical protein